MPTEEHEMVAGEELSGHRTAWRKPTVTTLDTWEAEAQDGSGTDSSGFIS